MQHSVTVQPVCMCILYACIPTIGKFILSFYRRDNFMKQLEYRVCLEQVESLRTTLDKVVMESPKNSMVISVTSVF